MKPKRGREEARLYLASRALKKEKKFFSVR